MVCDKCYPMMYQIADEIQLKHEDGCLNKWREDLILVALGDSGIYFNRKPYPRVSQARLNPDIHQKLMDGEITQEQAQYQNEALQH